MPLRLGQISIMQIIYGLETIFLDLIILQNDVWGVGGAEASLTRPLVITAEIHSANLPAFKLRFNNADAEQTTTDIMHGDGY